MICATDKEWQHAVKDGRMCLVCDERRGDHAHHLISRGVERYKRETRNGVALCGECHLYKPWRILAAVKAKAPSQYRWYQKHKNEVRRGFETRKVKDRRVLSGAQKRLGVNLKSQISNLKSGRGGA